MGAGRINHLNLRCAVRLRSQVHDLASLPTHIANLITSRDPSILVHLATTKEILAVLIYLHETPFVLAFGYLEGGSGSLLFCEMVLVLVG